MNLIVTEKNDAAKKIATLLGGKVKTDKVYNTPVYYFDYNKKSCVTIGLRGHILQPDFTPNLVYKKSHGWVGITQEGKKIKANIPRSLKKPPYKTKRRPYREDGIELKSWKMDSLPYLAYAPIEKLKKEKSIIRSLKSLAKKSSECVIATDFDREGELIGSDALACIQEVNPNIKSYRARYSAFTSTEINNAFNNLSSLDTNLSDAGETRQDIDLIWGAVLTRFLTLVKFAGYGNVRSSGRVQTPTLGLVVEKERERQVFKPQDYWVVDANFGSDDKSKFSAQYEKPRIFDKRLAEDVIKDVKGKKYGEVKKLDIKDRRVNPPAPFNTTSLMAAASQEGLTPARTMRLAESLYMAGYISYPRVDNTVYPKSLNLKSTVKQISKNPNFEQFCNKLLKKGSLTPTRGKKETTDHPPIYPTSSLDPETLSAAEYKLYNLIARRFLATLSDAATIQNTKITLDVNGRNFTAKGDVLKHAGFREIYPYGLKKDEQLPALNVGDKVVFNNAKSTHKQTEPPPRYSQGRLIQQMEKLGLGTKSTRHSIIERLYDVKYIINDPIEPTQLGIAVCQALEKFAPHITHSDMTSKLEEEMDAISVGKNSKDSVVLDSRDKLKAELDNLMPHSSEVGEALSNAVAADAYVGKCKKCGGDLQIRASSKTKQMFIGCSNWPDCDVTYPLPKGKVEALNTTCSTCGSPMIKLSIFRQKPKELCINNECPTNLEEDVVVGTCQVCKKNGLENKLIAHKNPKTLKRFIRCENFDNCNVGYPIPQFGKIESTGNICESCGAPIIALNSDRGLWEFCPNFSCPKKKNNSKKSKKK